MILSILILNYKTKGLLKQCVRGVLEAGWSFPYEVIVVDNHSQDGSLEMMRQLFPQVTTLATPKNVGFAAGMNLAYQHASGRYVMTLNTDVAVFRGAIETMVSYLNQHAEAGLVAPRLINPDGSVQYSCYQFYGTLTPIFRRMPFGHLPLIRNQLRSFLMSDWDHDDTRQVGWVLGACMIVRKEVTDRIGFFDERFFLYFDDVDLCRRIWQAGYQVVYVAEAELVHYHRRLSAENPGLTGLFSYPTRVHIQSWIKYLAKYLGAPKPPHSL